LAKKLESKYDRNIFYQLQESIELTEKLQKEIKDLKAIHRRETDELKTNTAKTEKEKRRKNRSHLQS
jgi:hypothetical protein